MVVLADLDLGVQEDRDLGVQEDRDLVAQVGPAAAVLGHLCLVVEARL